MHVIHQTELGGPEVLKLIDRPRPVPGPTEILVRVTAVGVNPLDWKTRSRGAFLREPPFTVGADVAGVVAEISEGVTRFSVGDRVSGDAALPPARPSRTPSMWRRPRATSPWRPLWRASRGRGTADAGPHCLPGARGRRGGPSGTARAHPWRCRRHRPPDRADRQGARGPGADEAIHYKREDAGAVLRSMDVVLDLVGGDIARYVQRTRTAWASLVTCRLTVDW